MVETVTIQGTKLHLFPNKTLLAQEANTLIISDVHLGKVIHFRKEGIAIPEEAGAKNLIRIHQALTTIKPKKVLFLGDLFHSDHNREWDDFCKQRRHFSDVDFVLVSGNHDILEPQHYHQAGIEVVGESYTINELLFTHEPMGHVSKLYNVSGHVHPKVRLRGKGNQSATLPCFYFGKKQGLMPAFGEFTGGHRIKPKRGDQVFGVLEKEVVKLTN